MAFTKDEWETSQMYDEVTKHWDILTNIPKHIRLYTRIANAYGIEPDISPEGRLRVILPEKAISHRRPRQSVVTEEQRDAARQRMQALHARRKAEQAKQLPAPPQAEEQP